MNEPKKQTIGEIMKENAMMKADIKLLSKTLKKFLDDLGLDLSGQLSEAQIIYQITTKLPSLLTNADSIPSYREVKALGPLLSKYTNFIEDEPS
jgi:hypothetical protein